LMGNVKPNAGHFALAELCNWFEQFTVVTQNVDGLHRAAGSQRVVELHGNIHRNKCSKCDNAVPENLEIDPSRIPSCAKCGGKIRPDVVWFGELLPEGAIEEAFAVSERADIFFSVGTSALVHPAASLPVIAKRRGAILVEINPEETPLTEIADYSFRAKSGELLPELLSVLRRKVDS